MDQKEIESIGSMLLRAKRNIEEATNVLEEAHQRLAYCFEKMSGKSGSIYGLPSTVGKFNKEE